MSEKIVNGPIKKILCPVDFSEFSQEAVRDSVQLAAALDAEVVFLHVVNQGFFEDLERLGGRLDMYEGAADRAMESLAAERRQRLEDLLADQLAGKVRHQSLVVVGIPWDRILKTANDEGADLILMGAKGRGGLVRHLRFGSSAEKIFRRAQCRVMFVR